MRAEAEETIDDTKLKAKYSFWGMSQDRRNVWPSKHNNYSLICSTFFAKIRRKLIAKISKWSGQNGYALLIFCTTFESTFRTAIKIRILSIVTVLKMNNFLIIYIFVNTWIPKIFLKCSDQITFLSFKEKPTWCTIYLQYIPLNTATSFGHIYSPSSGGTSYGHNSWYLLFFLDGCLLSWLVHSIQDNRQSSVKNSKYQLLFTYDVPPDDRL